MQKGKVLLAWSAALGVMILATGCAGWNSRAGADKAGFYRIRQNQVGNYQDYQADWNNSTTMREIFLELEEQCGAFLCSTWNYDLLDGTRRYTLNTSADIPVEYDCYGQSITVSAHYFDYTPVQDINGADVQTLLSRDPDTIDILVPEYAQRDADTLVSIYQNYMFFNNVEVDNIYRKAFGQPPNEKQAKEFSVNIIYVPAHTAYDVYDPAIACDSIEDCVVIVVNAENCHRVQLNAWLTQGFYVYSSDGTALNTVQRVYEAYDYTEGLYALKSVEALYRAWQEDKISSDIVTAIFVYMGTAILMGVVFFCVKKLRKR